MRRNYRLIPRSKLAHIIFVMLVSLAAAGVLMDMGLFVLFSRGGVQAVLVVVLLVAAIALVMAALFPRWHLQRYLVILAVIALLPIANQSVRIIQTNQTFVPRSTDLDDILSKATFPALLQSRLYRDYRGADVVLGSEAVTTTLDIELRPRNIVYYGEFDTLAFAEPAIDTPLPSATRQMLDSQAVHSESYEGFTIQKDDANRKSAGSHQLELMEESAGGLAFRPLMV
jgi:hypothetical protein